MDEITSLACRARDGDATALADFVRSTISDVRRYCGALVDTSSADDLTQETYLKAIPALSRYRGDAPAGAWLLSIARHTCIDEIRRRTRHRDRVALTLMVDPPREDIDEKLTIDTAIRALADDRREAFVLTQVIGLSYAEAAETIGCPVGTVRSRVFRARSDLIDALHEPSQRRRRTI
jgi:RNA polymerase sigma-70 factor (ECF subfamily)